MYSICSIDLDKNSICKKNISGMIIERGGGGGDG